MKDSKVTVLTSVYNGEKYLRKAIDSIFNQTFRDFEFLIINDGSTDRTAEILESYNDPRIKIINNEKNMGLTKSLNKGLKMAKGEYIARMDADDISMPDRLKKQVDFLDAHQDYAVVGTFVKILNKDSEVICLLERPIEDTEIRGFLKRDNCIAHGSVMIRKTCLIDVGLYDELMERSQDYELWLRLSEKYRLANIPNYLYMWRRHKENIEAEYGEEQKRYVEIAKVKARERRLVNLLLMFKGNRIDVKHVTKLFINIIAEKDQTLISKPLKAAFHIIKLATFNRIEPSKSYRILVRIRFSRRINRILRDLKMEKINFERAKLDLKHIVERRLI